MNSTVIHGIPSLFLSKSKFSIPFPGNFKPQKENSLSARLKTVREFWLAEREFSFWGLKFPGNGIENLLFDKKKVKEYHVLR